MCRSFWSALLVTAVALSPMRPTGCNPWASAQDVATIRSQAIVNLTFDEENGPALDSAKVGAAADNGTLVNDVARVSSPFWNQTGKRAIQLDPNRQQAVEIADSADVDRPDALTFSMFCVSLVAANDGAYRGLIAKRGMENGKQVTNYGINFTSQSDNFQLYLNDGAGYGVINYSVKEVLPERKLLFLTVTYQVGDAPGADADTDADDVRIQVYVNGQPRTPKTATRGFVEGTNGWLTDQNIAGLLNNIPLSLGRSEPNVEYFPGVIDEFSLFPTALSAEQVKQLFLEVAGANVESLIKEDEPTPPAAPEIARLSQPGITRGQPAQLAVVGKNFGPESKVIVGIPGAEAHGLQPVGTDRVNVTLNVPPTTPLGIYPVWVQTPQGISAAEPLVVDSLPQRPVQQSAADKPSELPAAFYGNLSGGQEPRVYFRGQKGQRLIADLELRRLGGKSRPVLELKTGRGTPIAIAWGQAALGGDVRLETVLTADGDYYVELHDLVYRAPGGSVFRLKLGDLKLIDLPFPLASGPGAMAIEPIGIGFAPNARWTTEIAAAADARVATLSLPTESGAVGPWPVVRLSSGTEALETTDANVFTDATFADSERKPVGLNGRLMQPGEEDRFGLTVKPGQKLRLTLQTASVGSAVEGELIVLNHPAGSPLTRTSDQPAGADPSLEFVVPENVTQVQVAVRDLFGRGNPRSVYRVEVAPAERPIFGLTVQTAAVTIPADGDEFIELNVTRPNYGGPIQLRVAGDPSVQIAPPVIGANVAGRVFCRLKRTGSAPTEGLPVLKIIGTTVDVQPAVSMAATLANGSVGPAFRDALTAGGVAAQGLSLELLQTPPSLYRGVTTVVPAKIVRQPGSPVANKPLRLGNVSTEAVRPRQPGNPAAGNFPLATVAPGELLSPTSEQVDVPIMTPLEVAENGFEFAIFADAVNHAYSDRVVAKAYAIPFRVAVQNAASPKLDEASLAVVGGTEHAVMGVLQRTAGFTGPLDVTLTGLPGDYTVQAANVPGDQDAFKLIVKAPAVTAEQAVPNVKLRVTSAGSLIAAESAVALKVKPAQ